MYKRFLNNNDYISIVTEEALQQLIRGKEKRLSDAEEAAEASIREYLTDNYEVEKELDKGKMLMPYNRQITYSVGSHFYYEGKICMAIRSINGIKAPIDTVYWLELIDYNEKKFENAKGYIQTGNYEPGDIVMFANSYFECMEYNGVDFDNIQIPGVVAWETVDTHQWQPNIPYSLWEVASFDGKFYTLVSTENIDLTVNPDLSDNWGLIGQYDENYQYEFSDTEFVEFSGKVYYPIVNPNADVLQEGFNIKEDDPRNANIKKHLLRLAVYELHKLISPNNVSSARITDYEATITWLRDANRCRINPGIPRKVDENGNHVTEFAIATFQRDYDPEKNIWQI